MKNNIINVFEYGTLHVASTSEKLFDEHGRRVRITQDEFIELQKFHSNISSVFFTFSHKKIIFKSYVGLLRIGRLNINILPKVDDHDESANKWHDFLIKMLLFTKSFRHRRSSMSFLKPSSCTILDLYIHEFYCEVEEVLRQGLVKSYSQEESNLNCIKGRILFDKDLLVNSSDRTKTFCRHSVYNKKNILNQVLHFAIKASLDMTNNLNLLDKGTKLLKDFPDMGNYVFKVKNLSKIKLNRNNHYYDQSLKLAKLIIFDTGVDLKYGANNVISFLFDMNQLFEEFVFKVCKKTFGSDDFTVQRSGKQFWENKRIKPDIIIENLKTHDVVVFDTKWKIPKDLSPDDSDLKQIFVYNHFFNSPVSYLLYPCTYENLENQLIKRGDFHDYKMNNIKVSNSCYLGFLPIISEGQFNIDELKKNISNLYNTAILKKTG